MSSQRRKAFDQKKEFPDLTFNFEWTLNFQSNIKTITLKVAEQLRITQKQKVDQKIRKGEFRRFS